MSTQTEEKKSVLVDWIVFIVTTAIIIVMLNMGAPWNAWFWVWLPFSTTSLVKALRAM